MREIVASKSSKIIPYLKDTLGVNYNVANMLVRKKLVKVNSKRANMDSVVEIGDKISIYYDFDKNKYDEIYVDDNILVLGKHIGIASVGVDSLESVAEAKYGKLYPVHRLDLNTEGLIMFARNEESCRILSRAIECRDIKKFYTALVWGRPDATENTWIGYWKKISDGKVEIKNTKSAGYSEVITKYRVLRSTQNMTICEIELVTGKMHQIRAHFASYGLSIIGDTKYGNFDINKKVGLSKQCLTATRLELHFKGTKLDYLDGREFTFTPTWLKYVDNIKCD